MNPEPRHLPPSAGGPSPDPALAERSCPGCGRKGTLRQLVAPTQGTGNPQAAKLAGRSAWLGCGVCPWTDEDRPEPGRVAVPGTELVVYDARGEALPTHAVDASVGRDVLDCLRDVPAHEPGGGGGNGRSRKKPGKRGPSRVDQEPLPAGPDKPETCTTVVETRSEVLHVRVSKGDKALAQGLANSHGQTVSDLMLWGLRQVNGFTPPAWWEMQHEAQQRGLPDATALLSHGFTEWWRLNVRETLG